MGYFGGIYAKLLLHQTKFLFCDLCPEYEFPVSFRRLSDLGVVCEDTLCWLCAQLNETEPVEFRYWLRSCRMFKPSETSNPLLVPGSPPAFVWGSGSCGGASWIFREGGIPGFLVGQEQRGHTRGTVCSTPSAFGSCLDLPVPVHGNPPGTTCQGDKASSRDSPRKIWWGFHLIPSPGSVLDQQLPLELWMAGPAQRSGAWCLPSTLSLVLGTFWDFSGVEEWFPSPHRMPDLPVWLEWVIGLPGGILLEPGM